jgi:hypothetical protein
MRRCPCGPRRDWGHGPQQAVTPGSRPMRATRRARRGACFRQILPARGEGDQLPDGVCHLPASGEDQRNNFPTRPRLCQPRPMARSANRQTHRALGGVAGAKVTPRHARLRFRPQGDVSGPQGDSFGPKETLLASFALDRVTPVNTPTIADANRGFVDGGRPARGRRA